MPRDRRETPGVSIPPQSIGIGKALSDMRMNLNIWKWLSFAAGAMSLALFAILTYVAVTEPDMRSGPRFVVAACAAITLAMVCVIGIGVVQMTIRLEERMDRHFLLITGRDLEGEDTTRDGLVLRAAFGGRSRGHPGR